MDYPDLRPAIDAYRAGRNVMETLRGLCGATHNSDAIIEIAYDLQAGSYAEHCEANPDYWTRYSAQLAGVLSEVVQPGDTLLDAGTGELTTLTGVIGAGLPARCRSYACDLSFSRIRRGRAFVERHLGPSQDHPIEAFVGNLLHLPFLDRSIDVVWTSHALEPNGGQEEAAIRELLRVARRAVVLFEPSYEHNGPEGRARMERLGYVRDLPGAVARAGGTLRRAQALPVVANPLNPTWAHLCIQAGPAADRPATPWACPATGHPLERRPDCFFSPAACLAYPILDGVPILRREQAILATALA